MEVYWLIWIGAAWYYALFHSFFKGVMQRCLSRCKLTLSQDGKVEIIMVNRM